MTTDNSAPPKSEVRWHHFRLPMRLLCLSLIIVVLGWYGVRLLRGSVRARQEERFAALTQLQHTALAESAVIKLLFSDYLEDLPLAEMGDWSSDIRGLQLDDRLPDSGTITISKDCFVSIAFSHPSADLAALKSYLQNKLDEHTEHEHDDSFPEVSIVGTTLTFRWPVTENASTQP